MAKDNNAILADQNTKINGNSKKLKNNNHQLKQMNGNSKKSKQMSIEDQFNAAVNVIQNLPKNGTFQPSDQLKLRFYAFYKQAKEGPNTLPKPPFYEVVARYKHDAWLKLGNMSKEDAMKNYVNELKSIVETMPLNDSISEFYDKLEPFFEFKKEKSSKKLNGESNNHQTKLNGNNQFTKDANYSSSSDSSDSDDFSDTVDNLSFNGDLNKENGHQNDNYNENNCFEDCTDINSKLKPEDLINAKGMDANFLNGQENYFYDCVDKNSVLNPNDIICARGETGIFSSRTNLPNNQEQSTSSRSFRQPLSIDNNFRSDSGSSSFYQNSGSGGGGGDRNYSTQNSDLTDIHEHLALTVLRLQQTVKSISNRIENLESKVNEKQNESTKKEIKKQNWWSNRTTQTTVLLILWPFAAHLIISAIKKKVNK